MSKTLVDFRDVPEGSFGSPNLWGFRGGTPGQGEIGEKRPLTKGTVDGGDFVENIQCKKYVP
jgi:hypothetical protein